MNWAGGKLPSTVLYPWLADITADGSLFQSRVVRGKKENRYTSLLLLGILVLLSALMGSLPGSAWSYYKEYDEADLDSPHL